MYAISSSLMNLSVFFALFVIVFMWNDQLMLLLTETPRYNPQKVKDHYCVAVFWKKFTYWFCVDSTLKKNVYWRCQNCFFIYGWRRVWWLKEQFKDCCVQQRDRLCGASLLVRVGYPMIVLLTCTPSLKEIWPGFTIEMRSMRHFWPLYWCCGPRLCGYGLKRAGLVLSMSTLSPKDIGCMDWPDPHLILIQQSMYGTYFKNIQVLDQLNNKCGITAQTRLFRNG